MSIMKVTLSFMQFILDHNLGIYLMYFHTFDNQVRDSYFYCHKIKGFEGGDNF